MNACDVNPNLGDLGVTGAKLLAPGDPLKSLISIRAHELGVARMPPLGTGIVDDIGTGIIDQWISQVDVCWVYPDTDADSIRDNVDNCTLQSNLDQRDTNQDGFGNICDADFNGTGIVDPADFSILRSRFGRAGFPDQDINGNGVVDPFDFSKFKSMFGKSPGPSGAAP
jgi:hypothetical protein